MADYLVPPGCYGLTMQDGTKYNADKHGRIKDVENPNHAYHIERNGNMSGGQITRSTRSGATSKSGTHCMECNFSGWGWQKICPKCGNGMEKDS